MNIASKIHTLSLIFTLNDDNGARRKADVSMVARDVNVKKTLISILNYRSPCGVLNKYEDVF